MGDVNKKLKDDINKHPHVVKVISINETKDIVYIVMEYYEGRELQVEINNKKGIDYGSLCFPEARIAKFTYQLTSAVNYLHKHGLIHRDLKPANVILTDAGLKVVDFGISTISKRSAKEAFGTMGTLYYAAPELFISKREYQVLYWC